MHGSDDERREQLNHQLQGALDSRVIIEQAKGFIAATCDTTTSEGFDMLRDYARRTGRRLREVATEVVERRIAIDDLLAARRQ